MSYLAQGSSQGEVGEECRDLEVEKDEKINKDLRSQILYTVTPKSASFLKDFLATRLEGKSGQLLAGRDGTD